MGSPPSLLPVIRQADFALGPPDDPRRALLRRPFVPCLTEFVVVDEPDRAVYVTEAQAAEWDMTPEGVFATAHDNLADAFRDLLEQRTGDGPQSTALAGMGAPSSFGSLPLLDGWIAAWSAGWGGVRPVFAIAVQGDLLIAPEPDEPEAIQALLAGIENEWSEPTGRPISPVLYTLDAEGKPVPFDVPADHPARPAIRRSRGLLAHAVYDGQTKHLRAQAAFGDPFYAALQRFSNPDTGASFTLATWGLGDMVLLPEADWVAFASHDEQVFVRWEHVVRECGLVPEPGYHPARYYAEDWPDAEVMTRLRALAERP
ncbi:MAG: hypothetical protein HOV87_28085 [Catenulispora sp.]|nr:hypothetical protein [Catenulispora sp.]